MRYKAYVSSDGKISVAEYRKGFKPESETHATREEALADLPTQQMTVREFSVSGFEVTGIDYKDSVEALAAAEMRRQGWKFIEYDENGDEVFEAPKSEKDNVILE